MGYAEEALKLPSYSMVCWHEHVFSVLLSQIGLPCTFLVSQSKDGEFVARLSEFWGFDTIRGSSSRGGVAALGKLAKICNKREAVGIAVDGPRGPRRVCKNGVAWLAMKHEVKILPTVAVCNKNWILKKTWDQTKIPQIGAKILCYFGPLISVENSLDRRSVVEEVQLSLDKIEEEAVNNFEKLWSSGSMYLPLRGEVLNGRQQNKETAGCR